jgi:hypothetical protein
VADTGSGGGGSGGGPAIAPITSTSAEDSHVFVSGSCTLYSISVVIGATSGWVMLFNATSKPANGAVTPARVWPVASDGTSGYLHEGFGADSALSLSTGCTLVFSTTGPLTLTASATAVFSAQVQ